MTGGHTSDSIGFRSVLTAWRNGPDGRRPAMRPPGCGARVPIAPGWWPVIGHLAHLARAPMRFMASLIDVAPVTRIYLGSKPIYVVNSLELVHELIARQPDDVITLGMLFQKAQDVLGQAVTVVDGELHHRHRRMILPVLQRSEVRRHLNEMVQVIDSRTAAWEAGRPFDANLEFQDLSMEVFGQALFSDRLSVEAGRRVRGATAAFASGIMVQSLYPHPVFERLPLPVNRRFAQARVDLAAVVDDLIDQLDAAQEAGEKNDDLAFLTGMLAAREPRTGQPMSRDQLRDEVMNLLLTGSAAPGVSLAWLFHELTRHPDIEQALIGEAGEIGDGPLEVEDLARIPLTEAVVKETLRLHAPTWFLTRHAVRDLVLGGYDIPADSELAFDLTALHRASTAYAGSGSFRPARWLDGSLADLPAHEFLPFGAGRHGCLGEHVTQQIMVLAVVGVLRQWRLVNVGFRRVRETPTVFVQPRGLRLTPQRIDRARIGG